MREHLAAAARAFPEALRDLRGPPFPAGTDYAYAVFLALHSTRAHGQGGAFPISYGEIMAYTTLTEERVTPHEVRLIRVADDVFLTEMAERMASASKGSA